MILQLIGGSVLYSKKFVEDSDGYYAKAADVLLLSAQPDKSGRMAISMTKMVDTPFTPTSVKIPYSAVLMATEVSATAELDAALSGIVLATEMPKKGPQRVK